MCKDHHLKTEQHYYERVESGMKDFELRKNDRDFNAGDYLYLKETIDGVETGRQLSPRRIKYILHGGCYGLAVGYCILGLEQI